MLNCKKREKYSQVPQQLEASNPTFVPDSFLLSSMHREIAETDGYGGSGINICLNFTLPKIQQIRNFVARLGRP